jgi:protein gp37
MTSIEWTDVTWNPVRGCSRVSPGCENCYAERQAIRMSGLGGSYEGLVRIGKTGPVWTGDVRFVSEILGEPLRWKKPRRVFVNSMSDLFHSSVTNEEIAAVFGIMAACPQHQFQILTKRAKRMHSWFQWASDTAPAVLHTHGPHAVLSALMSRWPLPNVHLLVSVEDQERAEERIPLLLETPAAIRGVSYEPALGPVELARWLGVSTRGTGGQWHDVEPPGRRLDWVIVGGESGPGARPFDPAWARHVLEDCRLAGVPCFVKQMGHWVLGEHAGFRVNHWLLEDGRGFVPPILGENAYRRPPSAIGFSLFHPKGGDPEEWPVDLRVREWPEVRA